MSASIIETQVVVIRDDALAYIDMWPGSHEQPDVSVYVEPKVDTLSAAQSRELAASLVRAAQAVEALETAR